jgi:DNA-directed RNA polymerase specialized sigma24 family protein
MNSVSSSGHSLGTSGSSSSNARELELLRQVAAGDRVAFKELYLIYHRRLARFLMRMTSRHDLIEEVINDTLWTVWLKAGDFRGDSLVSTWIVGITYRRALKALRRHGTTRPMLIEGSQLRRMCNWRQRIVSGSGRLSPSCRSSSAW